MPEAHRPNAGSIEHELPRANWTKDVPFKDMSQTHCQTPSPTKPLISPPSGEAKAARCARRAFAGSRLASEASRAWEILKDQDMKVVRTWLLPDEVSRNR